MPVFQLSKDLIFPDPFLAEDGFLAVGGDLSPERLILAYRNGIFPWYSEGEPICWHAPDPRFVLYPEKIRISKSMKQVLRSHKFEVTKNKAFSKVIDACKQTFRPDQDGTWINEEMVNAYVNLNDLGYAHSYEVWEQKELVGGLYGVSIGNVFFGESMFHSVSNASKIALIHLAQKEDYFMIDCQMNTEHLSRMGAEEIDLASFLKILTKQCTKD